MLAGQMLAGGARLVRTQHRAIAIWAVLYLVAAAAMAALIWPMMGDLFALQQQVAMMPVDGRTPSPPLPPAAPPTELLGRLMGTIALVDAVLLALSIIFFAAAVRANAAGGHDRFAFLRFGRDELRLFGLFLIVTVGWFVLMVAVVLAVAVLALIVAIMTGQRNPIGIVVVPLYLAVYGIGLWALVRLSLSGALTVLRGRIVLREAWRLTRGRFWTLFGVYLLICLVIMLFSLVAVALTNPALSSFYAGGLQPQDAAAMLARQQALLASLFGPRMIVTMVVGAAANTVVLAFACGAVATAAITLDTASIAGSEKNAPDRTGPSARLLESLDNGA